MISVPSHRLLLNGSKLSLVWVVLFVFFIAGCGVKKKTTKQQDVLVIKDTDKSEDVGLTKPDTAIVIVQPDTALIIKEDTLVKDSIPKFEKKNSYNLAMVLPFGADTIKRFFIDNYDIDYEEYDLPLLTKHALSFYKGFTNYLAELSEDSLTFNFNISVYDNKAQLNLTKSILDGFEANTPDVIVGPYLKRNEILVSNFTKEKDILHLSPFSPSLTSGSGNKNHIKVTSTLYSHFEAMIQYAINNYKNNNIVIVRTDSKTEKKYVDLLIDIIEQANADMNGAHFPYSVSVLTDKDFATRIKVADQMRINEDNLVIVPSFDENLIQKLLPKLYNAHNKDKRVVLFGMPTWINLNNIRFDYLNKLNFHYTTSLWKNKNTEKAEKLEADYKEEYERAPNEHYYLGYNLAHCFTELISEFGLSIAEAESLPTCQGITQIMHFVKRWQQDEEGNISVKYIENNALFIVKMEDYKLILAE